MVTRGATLSDQAFQAATNLDFGHTVDPGTDILLVYVAGEGNNTIDVVTNKPQWNGSDLTLIQETTIGGSGADTHSWWWAIVNPDVVTGTVQMRGSNTFDPAWCAAINYLGVVDTSVAAAANFLSEDDNRAATQSF